MGPQIHRNLEGAPPVFRPVSVSRQGIPSYSSLPYVFALSTLGSGSNEEARILALLENFQPRVIPFDRKAKWQGFRRIFKTLWRVRPDLVVMEGSGLAGGLALLAARLFAGVRYVVSSGDAIGPWVGRQVFWAGPLFGLYERILCRFAAGFIGWTPYLTGRALTFGAPRAMTAPGFAPFPRSNEQMAAGRRRVRAELGIAGTDIVFGLVGSLAWNRQVRYCYGQELVEALLQAQRPGLKVVVVGDGVGLARLQTLAGDRLDKDIFLPGRRPQEQIPDYLAAMDVVSLPQSVDQAAAFRYTTKISEYLAAGTAVVTGQVPAAYDLDDGWLWRLPGSAPWDPTFVKALAALMASVSRDQIAEKSKHIPRIMPEFSLEKQVRRMTAFIQDLLLQ
jgi:hypothetical protein